jgi:hypothetical protein
MRTWQVAVLSLALVGWLPTTLRAAEEPKEVGLNPRQSHGDLAPAMRERWKAVNEIAALIAAGNFARASELAKQALPLPKDMTPPNLEEMAAEFDERVRAFRHVLEARDTVGSLQGWQTVFQGCVGCHMEKGIKGQRLEQ